jgi:hypothetical protein
MRYEVGNGSRIFFFDKSICYIKKRRGAQPLVHWEYGSRILFWQYVWCEELPLKNVFPVLFTIAYAKEAWVEENKAIVNGVIHWNVMFICPVHDWEMKDMSRFFELLYSQQIRHGGVDKIYWIPSKRMIFEVKSCYKLKVNSEPVDGPWKIIWKSKVPPIVAFFTRIEVLGKILTMDNLCKKNIIVIEWCCMCKKSGESIDYLLLHCEVAI